MSNATVGEEYLSFKLSQEDTLKLCRHHEGAIGLDWKASDNTRGRSKILIFKTEDSGKDETI
ncbi:MAG: hypothetical protein IJH05_03460 [Firmicutes bacterium]|nr:hypothetical protein [Bacillota bacterium]